MNESDNRSKNNPTEREKIRPLGIIYDLIIFAVLFCLFFIVFPDRTTASKTINGNGQIIQAALFIVCVFGARLIFKVYRQVLRYGNAGAYARIVASDILGGAVYAVINYFLPPNRASVLGAAVFVLANMMVCIVVRLLYHYIFLIAQGDNLIGRICRTLLRRLAFVDARSGGNAEIMTLDQWLGNEERAAQDPINDIQRVARNFQIVGEVTEIKRLNNGYINRTYRITTISSSNHNHYYTLQRINTNVFPDVDALMDNFILVTDHLRDRLILPGHTERGSIQAVKSTIHGDKPYFRDDSGCWRMLTHFTGVYSMDIPDSPETFYWAGRSFGRFVKCMSDVPVEKVKTVIPNFHNTYSRYLDLEKAIELDPVHRLKDVWDEVNFIRDRKDRFGIITKALESGEIPTRICHNDCNLNNILFSNETHEPVAIIDLDTVMPSSPLYDYGDSMRIGTNTACDDEKDLTKVSCDLGLYERYARGYLEECGDMLTREELELLPFSSLVITSEDGIRFLMDYINGDTYYNIFYAGQNLDRARTQLRLLWDMENKLPQIKEILKTIYADLGLDADPNRHDYWK